jgi:beta-lactamase class A
MSLDHGAAAEETRRMLTRIVKLQGCVLFLYVAAIFAASDQRPVSNPRHLEQALTAIAERCGGRLGIAAVHVQSGRAVSVSGTQPLPLYSVVKLPLAVMVLKDVESAKIQLEQKVLVRREDVAPGSPGNAERWEKAPMNVTVRELLEFALVDSDNTSADKLFDLIGGPAALERRMHELGFGSFKVSTSMKQMGRHAVDPNTATAQGTVQLLVALEKGKILKANERMVLFDMMSRARTGQKRIVAGVPSGTEVLHKTGTGSNEVNDVGLITLPGKHGRIALAVMISESKLATADQERVVADAARTIYEAWE